MNIIKLLKTYLFAIHTIIIHASFVLAVKGNNKSVTIILGTDVHLHARYGTQAVHSSFLLRNHFVSNKPAKSKHNMARRMSHADICTYVKISCCENVSRVWTPADVNETCRTFIYFACPCRLFQGPNLADK